MHDHNTGIDCFDFWVNELLNMDICIIMQDSCKYLDTYTPMKLPWQLGADFFLKICLMEIHLIPCLGDGLLDFIHNGKLHRY